jgi:hypothetical protein
MFAQNLENNTTPDVVAKKNTTPDVFLGPETHMGEQFEDLRV